MTDPQGGAGKLDWENCADDLFVMVTSGGLYPFVGRRGPLFTCTCVEPAGGGNSCSHHPLSQHLDISMATKDGRLSVYDKGNWELPAPPPPHTHLGTLLWVFPWDWGFIYSVSSNNIFKYYLNLKSESILSVFSEVFITAMYFDNQGKNPGKQKIKQNKENLEHRFNFHIHLFL